MTCYGSMFVRTDQGEPIEVPCGQCIGCRLEKARQWAVRCVHEAQMHDENSFITLTYKPESLPPGGTLVKRDLQLFFKRLRKNLGKEIRFYACGEYGEKTSRPHYHACVFGHAFDESEVLRGQDVFYHNNHFSKGLANKLWRSSELEKSWQLGHSSVGEVTLESAGYVARYITKKITGDPASDHYQGKLPEFALMSRRPGIGAAWIEKYFTDVYPKDYFTINGIRHSPPRYYDEYLKNKNERWYNQLKLKRMAHVKDHDSLRKFQLANHRELITKSLRRKYEGSDTTRNDGTGL